MKHRIDWVVVVTAIVFAVSCSGGGCGGCAGFEPIPGGFPAAKRKANAAQVRVTQSGLAAVAADPAKVIGPLVGNAMNGVIKFPVPGSCAGTPAICCVNNQVVANCGPIAIDLVKRVTDPARLVLAPQQGQGVLRVTVRARIKTETDIPISIGTTNCKLHLDTTADATSGPDIRIDTDLQLTQDATAGTTRIGAANTVVAQLDGGDYSISPVDPFADFLCYGAAFIPVSFITDQLKAPLEDAVNGATCKGCPSGDVAECGSPFATSCTNKVCTIGNGSGARCLEEVGLDARARGTALFSGLSPGTTGALDLYEVAGGYSTSNNNGVALGMLGGMEPGGRPRDQCGPPSTEPAAAAVPISTYFQGNTRPDTAAPFDIGIGIHKSQLSQFAYAGYNGGLLCLTIGHSAVSQLSTDTIGLISRSLGKLVEGNSPVAIGLRPQSPPIITLGKNTFTTDGMGNKTIAEPLLDIVFNKMEIDFFAAIDEQYIRVFTVVADVHLPVGLQVTGMGTLAPVIGNPTDAFTNLSVKNSEAVTETPADLAALFPTVLGLALPQLSGALSPISLPNLGGLAISVTDVTAVDNNSFLAIFANLVPATMPRPVTTSVEIANVVEPSDEIAREPRRWSEVSPPSVTLALGGSAPNLEWSYRLDHGTWSAWSTNARPTIAPRTFWLAGVHHLEVRAQVQGHPETIDTEPVMVEIPLGTSVEAASDQAQRPGPPPFHGQAGAAGCGCQTGGAGGAAPFALMLAILFLMPKRRVRRVGPRAPAFAGALQFGRAMARLGPVVWLVALALLPGCSCGSHPCGDKDCVPGEVARGAVGRWTSIAGDDQRVVVATYDQVLGDLVVVDATDPANLHYTAVDGLPTDIPATHDPSTYRKGIEGPGADVGAWTSIAIYDHLAKVVYQDRDAVALKYAHEDAGGNWQSYVLNATTNVAVGAYASMVIDADHHPAVAFLAVGIDDGMSHRTTELRLLRASQPDPQSPSEWSAAPITIASALGSCAGACGSQACIAGAAVTDPQVCITPTSDCAAACAATDVCHVGACVAKIPDPTIADIPGGTGLYVSLVVLPDGRLAAAYYDNVRRALVLGVETAKGSSQLVETVLDGSAVGVDRGMWASAVVAGDGTIHIAYQDAIGDQLLYTTWNGTPGVPEVVDDGLRAGDRTHPVGAAASIYLVSGSPAIAYQDALNADVMLATRGATWSTTDLTSGPLLDGFSIAATTGHGAPVLAWDSLDPARSPPNGLKIQSP